MTELFKIKKKVWIRHKLAIYLFNESFLPNSAYNNQLQGK
jgi:hypothetical protein